MISFLGRLNCGGVASFSVRDDDTGGEKKKTTCHWFRSFPALTK